MVLTAAGVWYLHLDGGHVARYVDVTYSDASGGRTIHAFDSVAVNTVNWNFDDGKLWIGADTDWSQPDNWSPAGEPTAASYVLLDGTGTGVPVLMADTSLVGLRVLNDSGPASLTVNMPFAGTDRLRISDSLYIGDGGNLTHSANNGTHRLAIDVDGNLTIATGGKIDVIGKGYAAGQGPGVGGYAVAGSHGGRGASYQNQTHRRPLGVTYGSIMAPITLGSGGNGFNPTRGGGAIELLVQGISVINGMLTAQGATLHVPGAGGSIFLTTGTLRMNNGTIAADGGNGNGDACGAGGGRISVVLTAEDADFSEVTDSVISAYGGYAASVNAPGAAGTVYMQTYAQGASRGTLIVDNNRATQVDTSTAIDALVSNTTVGDLELKNNARFAVTNQTLWVHGNGSNAAVFAGATNGTVVLAGGESATVWGANTWGNLTITNRYKQVAFEAGKEQTILGTPLFDAIVSLQSTVPGVQWRIRAPGDPEIDPPQLVGAVIVRDSDASSGRTFDARTGSDQGNNLNWVFAPKGTMFMMR